MKRKRLVLLVAIGLVLLGIYLFVKGKSEASQQQQVTVTRGTLSETLTISGTIEAKEIATLRFQTSGKIASIRVKEGDIVKKYSTIATLDQRELQNNLKQLLNTYQSSRWSFDQTKSDHQTTVDAGATEVIRDRAKRIIDQSQFALNNAVLDVEANALAMEFSSLVTPIAGVITRVQSPLPGVNIIPTQAEFDVVNPDSMFFSALADQTDVTKLKLSQPASIFLDSYPETTISGSISTIAFTPKTDEVGTVYKVELAIPQDDSYTKFRIGMTGDVTFVLNEKHNILILPVTFITYENGKQFVTVRENNVMVKKPITIGLETETDVEVLSGVAEGDIVYD